MRRVTAFIFDIIRNGRKQLWKIESLFSQAHLALIIPSSKIKNNKKKIKCEVKRQPKKL